MFFARWRFDALFAAHKLAGDQGKQVARFFVRVHPLGKVAAFVQVAFFHQVAVAQQDGKGFFVGAQRDAVVGHHIGAVQEVGDAAKALGFALREERVVAHIQAHELGVLRRVAGGEDFQIKGVRAFGQVLEHQLAAVHLERGALAIHQHAREVELVAVQTQGLCRHVRVASHTHLVEHAGLGGVEVKRQIDGVDPIRGRGVVGALDQWGSAFTVHSFP